MSANIAVHNEAYWSLVWGDSVNLAINADNLNKFQ